MARRYQNRYLAHALTTPRAVGRALPADRLDALEQCTAEAERGSSGQIRVVIESSWPLLAVRQQQPRERALEWFSRLQVWDTEHNNGVLIYLLFAEHDVEIVADRGIDRLVGAAQWQALCAEMQTQFAQGRFERGLTLGIERIGAWLREHFPATAPSDRQPDRPLIV